MTVLFHKILGNVDNLTPDRLVEARENIKRNGLVARLPDEWKWLLPKQLRSIPVVWLIGHDRMIMVKKELLDKEKLFHLDCPEVDWWIYTDNILPEALEMPNEKGGDV